ncbi:hypothetical protein COLO4_34812 [Corchorus olitorius]|uniref:Leucine-rich repeat-containing N-terminal plant-type domain-containing protein n=1 Tax=Corchorus olitorius TaxID=93759 RepID=A0A1R3GJH7_9ROSI|nr:hypothetical protein COLO4_34812 [Corchorus olitorius]
MECWIKIKWLLWMGLMLLCEGCLQQEKAALLHLKPFFHNVDGVDKWGEVDESGNCCEWENVGCNSTTGRVIQLFLNRTFSDSTNGLGGNSIYEYGDYWYLNASLFLPFQELTSLYLSGISIVGCLPNQGLCELRHLQYLDISFNDLKGDLPRCFSNLTSLKTLDLSFNQFSGDISSFQSLVSLQELHITANYFQIPSTLRPLFNLSKLKFIYANDNIIYVETEMNSQSPRFQLEEISLSCCGHGGALPQFLYHQHNLHIVDLSNINFKKVRFPNWLLENNTNLGILSLRNSSLSGPLQLPPFASHLDLSYLDISNNFFIGNIPIEIGAQLPSLNYLNMSENYFKGSIPSSFGDMRSLHLLHLSNNQLSGEIPEHLVMGCSSLEVLALSNNKLQGRIFSGNFNLTGLIQLHLDRNNFSGTIADSLSNCSSLSILDVSNNKLSGRIPRWMGHLSSLSVMIMANNHLKGEIPIEYCELDHLKILDLSGNGMYGSLPSCFRPSRITQIHLSKNRLSGALNALRNSYTLVTLDISHNHFTGSIPSWIGGLSYLSHLLLHNNNFEGRILIELCKLSHLSLIDLSHNNLSGHIPTCLKITTFKDLSEVVDDYIFAEMTVPNPFSFLEQIEITTKNMSYYYKGKILEYMFGIDLSCNNLVGEIPSEFGNFDNILLMNLSHNSLTGKIPPTFGNLRQIESLDLSHNNLSGNIPPQLVGLSFLAYFSVAFNNLSGRAPERKAQFGTFEESSYKGNPFLCGEPLPSCSNAEPEPPSLSKGSTDNGEDDGPIDMGAFCVTFIVSYMIVLLAIALVLYINPYWRRAWFYYVETRINACCYFVVDNILPRKFHC